MDITITKVKVDTIFELNKNSMFSGKNGGVSFIDLVNGYPESLSKLKWEDEMETIRYWVKQFKAGELTETLINTGLGENQLWDGNHRVVAAKIAGINQMSAVISDTSIVGFEDDYVNKQ